MANYFSPTPPSTSHWEGRDDYVFLNLWKPVAVGEGNTQITVGTQRQSHFWIFLEFSLVTKYNTRFIKKSSQLNSDIQSYRYKDFSSKQLSGLIGERGGGGSPDPPDHPPGSATVLVPFDILSTAFGNSNTPIANSDKIKKYTAPLEQKQGKKLFFSLTSFKRYSPKLTLFHKCFSVQCGIISSLLPKCAGQNYVTWHALHDCTESWFACGSSTVVFVHCRGGKWNCYTYKFKFFIHFLPGVFPRNLLRSSMDS